MIRDQTVIYRSAHSQLPGFEYLPHFYKTWNVFRQAGKKTETKCIVAKFMKRVIKVIIVPNLEEKRVWF